MLRRSIFFFLSVALATKFVDGKGQNIQVKNSAATFQVDSPSDVKAYDLYHAANRKCERGLQLECEKLYRQAYKLKNFYEVNTNLGNLLLTLGQWGEARLHLEKAYALSYDNNTRVASLNNLGTFYLQSGGNDYVAVEKAIVYYDQALQESPGNLQATYNKATALQKLGRYDESIPLLHEVVANEPENGNAHVNLGIGYYKRGDITTSVYYQRNVSDNPINELDIRISALTNAGQFLRDGGYIVASLLAYQQAVQLHYDKTTIYTLTTAMRNLWQWRNFTNHVDALLAQADILGPLTSSSVLDQALTEDVFPGLMPYECSLIPVPPEWLRRLAEGAVKEWSIEIMDVDRKELGTHDKLTIGYLSYDYRDHPMGQLTVGLFEGHSRDRFLINAYSYGPDDRSQLRWRVARASDKFVDVKSAHDLAAAGSIKADQVDILVDLMAHTRGSRFGIAALKPARILVNYLAYPGTTGYIHHDYAMLDRIVVPPENSRTMTEKLVYLPQSYQSNKYPWDTFSCYEDLECRKAKRKEHNLPPLSFVFCDFNTANKIEPVAFAVWMSILKRVPNSVLWLLDPHLGDGNFSVSSLQSEAAARGVDPRRLVFAPVAPKSKHLERISLADLFIDTFVYDAHTTAADALWSGLPLVTLEGNTFQSRVASSILQTLGLPELVTYTVKEFEDMAVLLASNNIILNHIRRKLLTQTFSKTFFHTSAIVGNMELAYQAMWELYDSYPNTKAHLLVNFNTGSEIQTHLAAATYQKEILSEYERDHDVEKALLSSRRLAYVYPTLAATWEFIGVLEYKRFNYSAAEINFQRAFELEPQNSLLKLNLAHALSRLSKVDESEMVLREVLLDQEHSHKGFVALTILFDSTKNPKMIEELFHTHGQDAIRSLVSERELRTAGECYLRLGLALGSLGKLGKAAEAFVEATKLEPKLWEAWFKLAAAQEAISHFNESVATFTWAVRAHNEDLFTLHGAAVNKHPRPNDKPSIAIYCYEYGQTWWPNWGPSSIGQGIGGSEEAVIYISRELVKLGFYVEIYTEPKSEEIGLDSFGVAWYPYYAYDRSNPANMFVAWRYHISAVLGWESEANFVWLQDDVSTSTFSEKFMQKISGVFSLSQFALRRLPSHVREKAIVAANAMNADFFVDGENKQNHFIYGSSPIRGLETLLRVWPRIKSSIPSAQLTVYYGFTKAFDAHTASFMPNYGLWKDKIMRMLHQDGVIYRGMVNHAILAQGYAEAGFSLYPTTYPETGCVSLMKAQAMGAIPITSRYSESTLPELAGLYDLGPREIVTEPDGSPTSKWMDEYAEAVIKAANSNLREHRASMKRWARETYQWISIAKIWQNAYYTRRRLSSEVRELRHSDF